LDITVVEGHDLFNVVDDQAHLVGAAGHLHLDDHDAGALGDLGVEAELETQVDDGNDAAAQVDHALDVVGDLRDGRNFLQANDLTNLQHGDAIGLLVEEDGQVFAGELGGFGG